MTSVVGTVSAFQSAAEAKATPHSVTTNAQQTFNSTSVNQNSQSNSSALFVCGICGKEFGMRCRLVAHIRRHTGERPFSCNECGRAFSDAGNLQRHRYVHSSEPRFRCTVCGKSFRQASCLSTHRRFHCPGAEGRICVFCRRHFKSSASLQMHLRFKHRADAEAVVAVAVGSINSETVNSSEEGAKEPQQQEALPLPASSEAEQLSGENRQQTTCNNAQDAESCYRGVAMAAAAAFRRNFVHADSSTIGSTGAATSAVSRPPDRWRKAHIRKQVKVDESAIPTLEGITTDQLKLVAAAVAVGGSTGSGVPPSSALDAKGRAFNFPCPACPRRFVFQCRLAAHLRSHTNFRPFTCPDCGRAFTQRGYLVRHAAVHANERPFVCTLCDRAYKHYGSLVNHRRTHSKSSGAGTSSTSSKPRSRLGTSTSGPSGYRCVPTMAPLAAPALPMWASAGVPFAATASTYPSSAISQQQPHQSIFFRTPFSYLPTPQ
ncbi:hypothetical protein TcWFU_006045 [Taenia crassiceps]|uniref:C2H2-type domain-containing protein n=1 Tax=Taenia crassiceps TaxID=6207 RepID=A0ABR4PZZ6_9CEST